MIGSSPVLHLDLAAPGMGRSEAEHALAGPGEVGSIRKIGSMGRLSPAAAGKTELQRSVETSPQHIASEVQSSLGDKQMPKATFRKPDNARYISQREGLIDPPVNLGHRSLDSWIGRSRKAGAIGKRGETTLSSRHQLIGVRASEERMPELPREPPSGVSIERCHLVDRELTGNHASDFGFRLAEQVGDDFARGLKSVNQVGWNKGPRIVHPVRVAPGSKLGGACQRQSQLDGVVRVIVAAHTG